MDKNQHLLRRATHIFGLHATLVYYLIPSTIFYTRIDKNYAMLIFLICVLEFEYIRVTKNWQIPGIRPYEKYRFSAVFWTATGLFICYIMCPEYIGIPTVLSLAWIDPLMGELRNKRMNYFWLYGLCISFSIFLCFMLWLSRMQIWQCIALSLIASILCVLCETKKNYYIDDNFLMLVVPSIAVMCILTFVF